MRGIRPISGGRWAYRLVRLVIISLLFAAGLGVRPVLAASYLVKDQAEYEKALKDLAPGDELVLRNGNWRDFEIVFTGSGTAAAPISLVAETPGQVVISGASNLRIAGHHLVVRGLTFRDGYSPTREVIGFRLNPENLANDSRLTGIVIDGFNKSDRTLEDNWVALYGRRNQVDHSYFAGKTNKAPTLVVRLDAPESRENDHIVEHNFFGHRPTLGGNGGETIRIGVSDYSRTPSRTRISRNFFERCDGEVEIISIKSEGNLVTENVFFESRGAVVFRHGGSNEVSRNIFFGNGVSDTGGVRVINEQQTVKDNYFEGLRGEKFLSALTIMNGVPNSPINRYHQVKDSKVVNNSFIDFTAIGLAVGSDEERSAAPVDNEVTNNLFVTNSVRPVSIFDDISGIRFEKNVSGNTAMASYASIAEHKIEFERAGNGLLYPVDKSLVNVGAPRDLQPIDRADTGPDWFEKPPQAPARGRVVRVKKGAAALREALEESQPGDLLKLRGKHYKLQRPLEISHPIRIEGRSRFGKKTRLSSSGAAVFDIVAGGALTLDGLGLVGVRGNSAIIAASGDAFEGTYSVHLNNVDISADKQVSGLSFLAADPATFATTIEFDEVSAADWPGTLVSLSGTNLEGWYLAEDIKIRRSEFARLDGPLIEFGRAGRDESTFGPRMLLADSVLTNVNSGGVAINLDGIDGIDLQSNEISSTGKIKVRKRVLGLKFVYADNRLDATPPPEFLGVENEVLSAASLGAKP